MPAAEKPSAPFTSDDLNEFFSPVRGAGRIALAVSGGSDSTALLMLARAWAAGMPDSPALSVLTVDHGLRPQSAGEAADVARRAKELGVDHAILPWTGQKPRTGLQNAARMARYDLMTGWCRANGVRYLLTGHTIEDQAETIVMRLARGTGIEGLSGMAAPRALNGIMILRPFLSVGRQRLRDHLTALGVGWSDDPSNTNETFERVRVRKEAPAFARAGLTPQALAQTAHRALRVHRALDRAVRDFLRLHYRHHREGYCEVEHAAFLDLPEEIRIRVLDVLLETYGPGTRAELAGLERLERWFASDTPSRRATLGGCQVSLRARHFLVGREPGRIDRTPVPLTPGASLVWDGRCTVEAGWATPPLTVRPAVALSGLKRAEGLPAFVQAGVPVFCDGDHRPVAAPHIGLHANGLEIRAVFADLRWH
ncbi:tRNA lysidine(34) synthetase TilS [soil metagenome]